MSRSTHFKSPESRRLDAQELPPHSLEVEAAALGCCLLEPQASLNACEEAGVAGDWFYDLRHQVVWGALASLGRKAAPDTVMLYEYLKSNGALEDAGGTAYVMRLAEAAPSAANLPDYLEALREKRLLRGLLRACAGAAMRVQQNGAAAGDLLAQVERELQALGEGGPTSEQKLRAVLLKVMEKMDDYHRGRAQIRGLTTGLEYVDKLLCGMGGEQGNYYVISARPSLGKTTLAVQIAAHLACDYVWFDPVLEKGPDGKFKPVIEVVEGNERFKCQRRVGLPVGIFSLEMEAEALVKQMLFQRASADMQRWRTGFAENDAWPLLTKAAGELHKPENVLIEDEGRITIDRLRGQARRWQRQYGVRLLVIDYIQLLRSEARRFREDRRQELSEISAEIQALGKELQIPIIVLAQMNRDYEKEPTRPPRLSDLKDCGCIEQDADVVGFLYAPKLREGAQKTYDEAMAKVFGEDWSKFPKRVNLLFCKNRRGPKGGCELLFQASCTRFFDYGQWLKERGSRALALGERE